MSTTTKQRSDKPNKLIDETSTYLLQHAYNPVEWYPWGPEALGKARSEDKPILLSIGYAACHWCHVMEHESFEDQDTATLMNNLFVNIKVDREERTDLDEIYMKAVQMMTGHGGWPMTVFLTPELKPFFAGTYFPPVDKHGMPSFKRVLLSVATAWKEKRDDVLESAGEIASHLKLLERVGGEETTDEAELAKLLSEDTVRSAAQKMARNFDPRWGGFGSAPKFPHAFSLMLTMRAAIHKDAKNTFKSECKDVVETTLDRMAYGGIQDHLAGGFARYSVDRQWLIPHFEKMLYDNALLTRAYLDGYLLYGREYWKDVACGILDFVGSELRTANGAFYSSLDADSEGEEGKFYVWREEEIKDILGEEDGAWFCVIMGVSVHGNFEHGTNALHFPRSPEELASEAGISVEDLFARLNPLKKVLLDKRAKRVRPGRDEKVLTSWNSLMISAYVHGYVVTREKKYLEEAKDAANFIFENLMSSGRLLRTWGQGKAKLNGYLDDYAFFIEALLDLSSVLGDKRYLSTAIELADYMLEHFWDREHGGFYFTSDDHEELIVRPKNHFDGSVPSGASVAVMDLLRLARLTDNDKYLEKARKGILLYGDFLLKAPDQFANTLCALDFYLSRPREIVLVQGVPADEDFVFTLNEKYDPNKIVVVRNDGDELNVSSPLLEGRTAIGGKPTVYICRNYTCAAPLTDLASLKKELEQP